MTIASLKEYIEQALKFSAMTAEMTPTKIDDYLVDALKTLSTNDSLINLVGTLIYDGDVDVPEELNAEWQKVQPALGPLQRSVKRIEE